MTFKAVCFDLGGVLVKICQDWNQLAAEARATGQAVVAGGFEKCQEFSDYQSGLLSDEAYLAFVARQFGVTPEEARRIHNLILIEPYQDSLDLVRDIEAAGLVTGCLSNTNAIHWHEMVFTDRFPAVSRLQCKTASHLVGASKPDPAIYRAFEDATGLSPGEIVNFDDSWAYVEAANTAGWCSTRVDPVSDPVAQMRETLQTLGLL